MTNELSVDEYAEWNAQQLARQPVTRRWALTAAAAGALAPFALADAAFTAGGGTAGSSGVVVSGRHLSFVPGKDGLPTSAMAVTAQLVSKTGSLPRSLRAYVEVGTAPGQYGTRVEADIQHLVGQYAIPGGPAGSQFYLKATVADLRPGELYHYRVYLSDGTVSGDAHFTTAPGDSTRHRPFTFTAFADVGTNTAPTDPAYAWGKDPSVVRKNGGKWPTGIFDNNTYEDDDPVAGRHGTDRRPAITQTNLMASQNPRFTLLAGDICYANPSGTGLPADDSKALSGAAPKGKNRYNPYVWDVFLNQIEPQAAYTPWMFATGNHDMEPLYGNTEFLGGSPAHGYGGLVKRLDMPGNGPRGCPSVYTMIYANVGIISIDANDLSTEIQTNTGYSGGAQLTWLKQTLHQWRTDPSYVDRVDFIVVFFHHCAYSTSHNHASDGGVRNALDPLFSRYRVDLAVQGHNHLMERTDPIRYGRRTRPAPDGSTIRPADDGVTYVCVGSGGAPRYPFRAAPSKDAPPPPGVKPTGAQRLPAGQRYRGYRPPRSENTTENIANGYVWSGKNTALAAGGHPRGSRIAEEVDWSQVRYDAYAFIAVDVEPAARGQRTTMTIRTLADALPGSKAPYTEIDRITLARTAGLNAVLTA